MNAARIAVILISVFFVASILASSFLYTLPEVRQPDGEIPDVVPTRLAMEAENVPARVVLLLPKLKLMAETSENNINDIDASIYSIQGVRQVSSFYSQTGQTTISSKLVYIADVFLSNDLNAASAFEAISGNAFLENVDGFAFALVSLPKEVEFLNPDLNLSKTYSLKRNESETLASLTTLVGDEISVGINATFIGEEVLSMIAYEVENVTSAPLFGEVVVEAEVASLEPGLSLDFTSTYSQLSLLSELEQQILSVQNVLNLDLEVPVIEARLSLSADSNISGEKAADLNTFLHSLGAVEVAFYNAGFFIAGLLFEEGTDIGPITASINEKISLLELEGVSMQEATGRVTGEVVLEGDDASKALPGIKSLLEGRGFGGASVSQSGEISLAEVTHEETGGIYAIDSNSVEAVFTMPHSVGESVGVSVFYSIVREKIVGISAVEN